MTFKAINVSIIFLALTLMWACKNDPKPESNGEAVQAESEIPSGATFAVTLDGKRLMEIPEPDTVLAAQKTQLETARSFYLGHLSDVKSYLGYGATALKFGMVELALQILSKGIDKFPNTSDLYLYRGMAAVQGRQFTSAINDLWKAGKAVEGQPNVKGLLDKTPEEAKIDASLHYEIYKWMGLAFQCQGDFSNAEKMYEICSDFSTNSDLYCMAYYWQYQAFVRAGRENDAKAILERADAKMFISPVTKPYLDALLYYKGEVQEKDLVNLDQTPTSSPEARDWTIKAYAIAVKALVDQAPAKQLKTLETITAIPYWNQMPYIAAEADLHKIRGFQYQEMETKELKSGTQKPK